MTLPIRTLPIVEQWDCRGCGVCCHGTIISLSDDDLENIRRQQWEKHDYYRHMRIVTRHGWLHKHYRLAKRPDGTCIFLAADGRCRIHRDFGPSAKPLICQMAPLQLVPAGNFAWLTLRRYCAAAAADQGRPLAEHLPAALKYAEHGKLAVSSPAPPQITPGHRRAWPEFLRVAEAIERLLLDERYPPVRRLVHGLHFCDLLSQCRLERVGSEQLGPLVAMLENTAVADERSGELFRSRPQPGRAGGLLFRQVLLEYARLHPKYVIRASWRERWRLTRAAVGFARGKGPLPFLHECFAATTFEALERPLGHLDAEVLRPLMRYFETAAASKRYAILGRARWSLVESYRALALSYAAAMWLLRLSCGGQPPSVEHVIDVVATLDRGQGYASFCGTRHRRRVQSLAQLGELPRLVAWYAR